MLREADIEDYLGKCVKRAGGEVRKVKWIGRNHAPDRLVMLPSFHSLVELKAPGKKPTHNQLREHERLREAGFYVFVIDSLYGVERLLERRYV